MNAPARIILFERYRAMSQPRPVLTFPLISEPLKPIYDSSEPRQIVSVYQLADVFVEALNLVEQIAQQGGTDHLDIAEARAIIAKASP